MKWACDSLKDIVMEILSTRLKRKRGIWEDRPAAWVGVSRRGQTIGFAIVSHRSILVGLEITGWFPRSTWEDDQ